MTANERTKDRPFSNAISFDTQKDERTKDRPFSNAISFDTQKDERTKDRPFSNAISLGVGGVLVVYFILFSTKVLSFLDLDWNTLTVGFGLEYFDFGLDNMYIQLLI